MSNYSTVFDEGRFIEHFSTYLNMLRTNCEGFSYTRVTRDVIVPTMNFLFPKIPVHLVDISDYCDLHEAVGRIYFDIADTRYLMRVSMIRGGDFPRVTVKIDEIESLFSENMKEAVDILRDITVTKQENIRIINKLIRGLSNGEFEPKDIIGCSQRGDETYIQINKSFYKAIDGHPYFLRFNIETARDKNFKGVKVEHTDGVNVFKIEVVNMDSGDY